MLGKKKEKYVDCSHQLWEAEDITVTFDDGSKKGYALIEFFDMAMNRGVERLNPPDADISYLLNLVSLIIIAGTSFETVTRVITYSVRRINSYFTDKIKEVQIKTMDNQIYIFHCFDEKDKI